MVWFRTKGMMELSDGLASAVKDWQLCKALGVRPSQLSELTARDLIVANVGMAYDTLKDRS